MVLFYIWLFCWRFLLFISSTFIFLLDAFFKNGSVFKILARWTQHSSSWIEVVKTGNLVFFLVLQEKLCLSPYSVSFGIFLYTLPFNSCGSFLLFPSILLFNKIFCINWNNHIMFSFHSVNVILHGLSNVEPFLHSRNSF